MKYRYDLFPNSQTETQLLILENIKRQKRKVNNNKKYSDKEKILIMKGLDLAFDRAWAIGSEKDLL